MIGEVGQFLYGVLAELVRVTLVVATGALSAQFFGGRMVGGGGDGGWLAVVVQLAIVSGYALLVIVPARDIVHGWLGMIAGYQPPAYDEPAQNVGRAVADVALAAGGVVMLAVTMGQTSESGDSASSEALVFAYTVVAILVFCIAGAVPRLWFGLGKRRVVSGAMPELLRQAGRRAAIFCYATFVSVGLALGAARAEVGARGLPAPRAHRATAGGVSVGALLEAADRRGGRGRAVRRRRRRVQRRGASDVLRAVPRPPRYPLRRARRRAGVSRARRADGQRRRGRPRA